MAASGITWGVKHPCLVILFLQSRASDLMVWTEACTWGLVMGLCSGQPGCDLILLGTSSPGLCKARLVHPSKPKRPLLLERGRTVSVLSHRPVMGTSQATLRENEHLTREDKNSESLE